MDYPMMHAYKLRNPYITQLCSPRELVTDKTLVQIFLNFPFQFGEAHLLMETKQDPTAYAHKQWKVSIFSFKKKKKLSFFWD